MKPLDKIDRIALPMKNYGQKLDEFPPNYLIKIYETNKLIRGKLALWFEENIDRLREESKKVALSRIEKRNKKRLRNRIK